MRILQIFNPYVNYGGEEEAVNQISEQLEKNHELRNLVFDIHAWAEGKSLLKPARQLALMVWNPASVRLVRNTIAEFKPDVILVHNLMPVGSAALYLFLSRCGIPLIQYIHNFRPFSVNGYCWGNNRIIADGLELNFIPEVLAASWQESRVKTLWYALLLTALHRLGVYRAIHGWIAISHFMKDTFVSGGIEEDRIQVIPHSWSPKDQETLQAPLLFAGTEPVFLFLGRITEAKGLRVLLEAWEIYERGDGRGILAIAGDGPLAEEVKQRCDKLKKARYVGFCVGSEKEALLRSCTALIVPSVWWEPLGLVLYEAYAHAKPVLAAASGGILDHVTEGVTGWIHQPGNSRQLADQIREVEDNPSEAALRGANGRARVSQLSPARWVKEFNVFVNDVITRAKSRKPTTSHLVNTEKVSPLAVTVYLADQTPKLGRSLGISRMTDGVLGELQKRKEIALTGVASLSSIRMPDGIACRTMPWNTRNLFTRVLSDHIHPLFDNASPSQVCYYPKGFLPALCALGSPSVVTIHDTIVQYYAEHYPAWRSRLEYAYWAAMLKHTLTHASHVLTVSQESKRQIIDFMLRHQLPPKEITVTYEPCLYENIPQPVDPVKESYVLHLSSLEPHKKTAWLVDYWLQHKDDQLPVLHVVGTLPKEVRKAASASERIRIFPFLDDTDLRAQFEHARALVFPSEIEGFGLPAIEAYYLGTPVCFVKGTSVEEILSAATDVGGFDLTDPSSFVKALDQVLALPAGEVHRIGLRLRETYAAKKVVDRMCEVFQKAAQVNGEG